MGKYGFFLKGFCVDYNGVPSSIDKKYKKSNEYVHIVKFSYQAFGFNDDKRLEGGVIIKDMDKEADLSKLMKRDRFFFSADLGNDQEIDIHAFCVEKELWINMFFSLVGEGLYTQVREYINKLEFAKILTIPEKILPICSKALKEANAEKEKNDPLSKFNRVYEIGVGNNDKLEAGINKYSLKLDKNLERVVAYFPQSGPPVRDRVILVPKGNNGALEVSVIKL